VVVAVTRLQVEVDDFVASAVLISERVADPVCAAVGGLTRTLERCRSMAGDDPGGQSWAESYDASAQEVLAATQQLVNGAYRTSTLLGRSATNYAEAEAASTTGVASVPPAVLQRLPAEQYLGPAPPLTASGGGGDTPTGWSLISHTVGYVWPNGHQDRLHKAAAAWSESAETLHDAAAAVGRVSATFVRDALPEADDISAVCTGLHDRLLHLAEAHRALSTACTGLAHRLDHCHAEVTDALSELLVESAGIQIAGGLLSIVSFGIAEAPAQGVQAARIAAVAARVGHLIERFNTAARTLGHSVTFVRTTAEGIRTSLQSLTDARLAHAGVTNVPRLAHTGGLAHMTADAGKGGKDVQREVAANKRLEKAGLVPRAPAFGRLSDFKPPKIFRDKHGRLTNGEFTISAESMGPHTSGSSLAGKSQFFANVDSDKAVLDAASFARKHDLIGADGKAKVFVENGPVGVWARDGRPTHWINVYISRTGTVHGSPGGPP
jgi:hypothetical protein